MVQNLLAFARQRQPEKEYSDINDIVQKALQLRDYELKTSNIEVVTDLAHTLPKAMVDFYQIVQVFLNTIPSRLNSLKTISELRLPITTEEIDKSKIVEG